MARRPTTTDFCALAEEPVAYINTVRRAAADGDAPTTFSNPSSVCWVPSTRELIVTDSTNHRLSILSSATALVQSVRTIGQRGGAPGQLRFPRGVACDGIFIWVGDSFNHRVQKLRFSDGAPVAAYGEYGDRHGEESVVPLFLSVPT